MPLCRDVRDIIPYLERRLPLTSSLYYRATGAAGGSLNWARVDDLVRQRGVLARSRSMLTLYADDARAAGRLAAEVPRTWRLRFGSTPLRFRDAIRRNWPRSAGRGPGWREPCYLYALAPGRLVVDRRHRVVPLRPGDAPLVARHWPHGRSTAYVRSRIKAAPGCGVRRDGRLVAWGLTHDDGAMGFLHVLEEYRGMGLARSLTTALAGRLLRAGITPFLYIVQNNRPSIRLTESMGFTRRGEYGWFGM